MNTQWLTLVVAGSFLTLTGTDGPTAPNEGSTPATIELRSEEVSIPLYWFGRTPVVEVKINGRGPFRFYLDTGAQGSVLAQELAKELHLPVAGEVQIFSPGGKGLPAKKVRLDRVELGDAVFAAVPAYAFNLSQLGGGKDAPRGVLSAGTYPGYLMTFDYPRSRLLIRRGELPPADGMRVFSYDAKQPLPEIPLNVAGQEIDVHLDSGSGSGITLPLELAGHLPLVSKPVEVARGKRVDQEVVIFGAKLNGEVKLGQYVLKNPDLQFQDIPNAPGQVGYDFLHRFAITVDVKNHRLKLEQGPTAEKPKQDLPRRYGVRFRGFDADPLEVLGVDPGSPAEKGGLRKGDIILRLNDKPLKSLNPEARAQALRSSPLSLQVQRGDQAVALKMALDQAVKPGTPKALEPKK